jgi:hypothetical protein
MREETVVVSGKICDVCLKARLYCISRVQILVSTIRTRI